MSIVHHVSNLGPSQAQIVTYTSTGATVLFWGLHISDIAVLMSAFASICGVALQFYLALRRIERIERRQDSHIKVTGAVAKAVRAEAKKGVDTVERVGVVEDRVDNLEHKSGD